MNRRLGKGNKMNITGYRARTSKILYPQCLETVAQEIKKIKEQNPELSDKEIF